MKATLRTFKSMQAKAVKFGYPQELIEVEKDEIRFYFQNSKGNFDPVDMRELAENTLSRIAEFFVGYDLTIATGNNIAIQKGGSPITLEGFSDPMHY